MKLLKFISDSWFIFKWTRQIKKDKRSGNWPI
jgi:hypothetical protein